MSAPAQFWVRGMLVRYTDRWETLAGDTWRIAGPETKGVIDTHLGAHCAVDDYPSEAADRALRGPGENEGLRLVASDTNETTPAHWLARAHEVTDAINALGVSSARLTVDGDHWTLEISTGGWADCEFLLGELQRGYKTDLFWMMFWESSRSGGHHVLRCDLGKAGDL